MRWHDHSPPMLRPHKAWEKLDQMVVRVQGAPREGYLSVMHYTTIVGRLVGGDITIVGIALLLVDNYSESCIKMAYRAATEPCFSTTSAVLISSVKLVVVAKLK